MTRPAISSGKTAPALTVARTIVAVERLVREENGRRRASGEPLIPEPPDLGNPDMALTYAADVLTIIQLVPTLWSNVLFLETYARNYAKHFEEACFLIPAVRVMES